MIIATNYVLKSTRNKMKINKYTKVLETRFNEIIASLNLDLFPFREKLISFYKALILQNVKKQLRFETSRDITIS